MIRSKLVSRILSPLALLAVAAPASSQDGERMQEVVSVMLHQNGNESISIKE